MGGLKGFKIGDRYEVIREPKLNQMSGKVEGMWIKHLKIPNLKNWMTLDWINHVLIKYGTKEERKDFQERIKQFEKVNYMLEVRQNKRVATPYKVNPNPRGN